MRVSRKVKYLGGKLAGIIDLDEMIATTDLRIIVGGLDRCIPESVRPEHWFTTAERPVAWRKLRSAPSWVSNIAPTQMKAAQDSKTTNLGCGTTVKFPVIIELGHNSETRAEVAGIKAKT